MGEELKTYLQNIRSRLRLGPEAEREVLAELRSHLEDRAEELRHGGMEEGEAWRLATAHFGSPAAIAQEMYRTHSQGDWRQAFLAALPHLLVALFFALHLWLSLPWLMLLLMAIVAMSLWGWRHGIPLWLFPWLGYSLIPVLGAALFLLSLPPWSYLALVAYIPLAWWLLSSIARQAVRRDWLYGSLVLLPFPILGGWLFAVKVQGGLAQSLYWGLMQADSWIALSFVTLALTSATFIRVAQRRLRAGALLTPELVILLLVALSTNEPGAFLWLLILALLSLGLLLTPALLKRGLGHGTRH